MATDTQDLPITHPPAVMRSASDSVVNGKGRPAGDVEMCYGHDAENAEPWNCNRRCEDIALHTTAQGTQVVAARELNKSKPVPSTNKARQQLQLPSFHALGIAVPYPTSILTPPDEPATMNSMSPNMGQSQSTPTPKGLVPGEMQASNTPQSPFPPGSILGASNDTPTQAPVGSVISPSIQSGNAPASGSSNSSTATETGSNSSWLDQAIQAILPLIPTGNNATTVINVLYHPQPCPSSPALPDAPNALTGIVNALQARFEQFSADKYIEVTHAVPSKFNFSQLPNSPVTTPNRPAIEASMGDYFSVPKTVVYSKGVSVSSHAESRQNLNENPNIRGIPQTAVAPSSVTISVLERFIPPATSQEYLDLFQAEQPSALADRLTELKPDNGSLVFVYPTYQGAFNFKEKYLLPILDPQLRFMNLVNGIPLHLVTSIARLEAVDKMQPYDHMRDMVSRLLARMNQKGNGSIQRFAMAAASKQTVHMGREAWAEWYLKQELPRIRKVIDDYYGRTLHQARAAEPTNSTDAAAFTTAGFVREIIETINGRAYDNPPREGIEVGVFVIKRFK